MAFGDRVTAREVFRQLARSAFHSYADRARFEGWLLDEKHKEAPEAVWDDWRAGLADAAFVGSRSHPEHRGCAGVAT